MWEGRVLLSPEIAVRPRRGGLWLPLLPVVYLGSLLLLCPQVLTAIFAAFLPLIALITIGLMAVSGGSSVGRFFRAAGRGSAMVVGAAAMATGGALRNRASAVEARPVLMVRLDAGHGSHLTVAISGVSEGVRQGDRVTACGPRVLGVVRALYARNLTTGRVFVSVRGVVGLLGWGAVVAIPLTLAASC